MAKSCKCDPHELCEECPEWIFTLADLIMCMMGLFVLLWVLKPGGSPTAAADPVKVNAQNEVIAAIRDAFGYIPDAKSNDPIDRLLIEKLRVKQFRPMNGEGEGGKTKVPQEGAEGTDPRVVSIRNGPQAMVGTAVQFEAGQTTLSEDGLRILNEIAVKIKGHRNVIMIKGHAGADEFPESATAQQKLELSYRRAQAVVDYLTGRGVEPEILRVQGCSTFEPIVKGTYTPEALKKNRRVEVEATSLLLEDVQARPRTATETPVPQADKPKHGE